MKTWRDQDSYNRYHLNFLKTCCLVPSVIFFSKILNYHEIFYLFGYETELFVKKINIDCLNVSFLKFHSPEY